MPSTDSLAPPAGNTTARTHNRMKREEVLSRLTEYVRNNLAGSLGVIPALPNLEEVIKKTGVTRSSFYRMFSQAPSFDAWALRTLIEITDLYATDTVCAEIKAVPADIYTNGVNNTSFVRRTGHAIVNLTDHVRAIRIEQLLASMGDSSATTEIASMIRTAQFAHITTIGLHLEEAHKWFGERVSRDDSGSYASALFDTARGFALSPFGQPEEAIQHSVFAAISARFVHKI